MAFEEGNQAAAKGRKIEKMIERALVQEDDKRLREGVEKLLDNVANGERWALEFVRDSIDGKPKQQVVGSGEGGEFITKMIVELVNPSGS